MTEVIERIDSLEKMMKDLIYTQRQTEMKLATFIEEMREFKDEMKEFKTFTQQTIDNLNKKWGQLANRLGTIAEDLILPCFTQRIEEIFGLKNPFEIRLNNIIRKDGNAKEFDIIVIYSDYVLLNEVKATATPRSIKKFVDFVKTNQFFDLFPYLDGKTLIPFVSSIKFTEEAVNILTENKIYALTPCPNMQIINFDQIKKTHFKP